MNTRMARAADQRHSNWDIAPAASRDIAGIARLFLKLHQYNASLDPHFALAEGWEQYLTKYIEGALSGQDQLALLARDHGRPVGFVLAAAHHDSALWRHRDWVEVEALYVERSRRGCGLADELLNSACA